MTFYNTITSSLHGTSITQEEADVLFEATKILGLCPAEVEKVSMEIGQHIKTETE